MKNIKENKRGVTLIEMIIVLAIMGVIFGIAFHYFSGFKNSQAVRNAGQDILSSLSKARSYAFASVSSSGYGVHFEASKVVIFKGTSYSSGALTNEMISVISPATISNVTLNSISGTSGELYFNRLTGVPSKTGTVRITAGGVTKTVTISSAGAGSIN